MPVSTIEIGHTYAPERFTDLMVGRDSRGQLQFKDKEHAKELRELADTISPDGIRVALVDDVAAREKQKKSQDSWRWAMFIGATVESVRFGTQADFVELESRFELPARRLTQEIKNMELSEDYRFSQDGKKLIVGSGKGREVISLEGFSGVEDPSYPSCQMLDLAWLQHRLTLAPYAINVLPRSFEEQQKQVGLLADLFPEAKSRFVTEFID